MSACPSPQVLRRVGSGLPGDSANALLDAHIDACEACQAALSNLAREHSLSIHAGSVCVPDLNDLPRIPGLEIERELGRGGMGVVYLAREHKANRSVAVKFLPSGPFAAPRDRER